MLKRGKADEGGGRFAKRPYHGAAAFLDLGLALLVRQLLGGEIGVRPGVRADGVAVRCNRFQDFRMPGRVLADREEDRLGALVVQRLDDGGRVDGPRTVVEGQYDFLFAQEVELLEMLEAEAGPAGGVDGDDARDAERVRISAGRFCRRGRRCWWSRFCGWH